MRVLILGAKGMLGQALAKEFQLHEPALCDRDELDITDIHAVFRKLDELRPTHVINAAAYTNVDGAEDERDLATHINADAVGYLASACAALGSTLVHYSTDYIFDGLNPNGYRESDEPQTPANAYGESKALGERLLKKFTRYQAPHPLQFYLIRSSWLYGSGGKNFVNTILEKAREGSPLKVVKDQRGKPTYARDLARRTREILEEERDYGVYHVTNETPPEGISWYEFARGIFEEAQAFDPAFAKIQCDPCFSNEFPRPARRPPFSMLRNTKLLPMRPWQEALRDYLKEYFS